MKKKAKKNKTSNKRDSKQEIKRQLKLINTLATKLPWIAVIIVLISMVFIMLEMYFRDTG